MTSNPIRVPDDLVEAFKRLSSMSEADYQRLIQALEATELSLAPADFVERAVDLLADSDREHALELLGAILPLFDIRSDLSLTDERISASLSESDNLEIGSQKRDVLKHRLLGLLRSEHLAVTAKSAQVLSSYERTMHGDPLVLTDIRPIFGNSVEEPPLRAAIVHMLKVPYDAAGETRAVYVAMTPDQMGRLRDALDRAEAKGKTLAAMLEVAGVKAWDANG